MSIQHVNAISNRLSLRPPQHDSLEFLARVCGIVSLDLSACGHAQAGMDGDWQLGLTRRFFAEGVQERFAQSRFDTIREHGRIAEGVPIIITESETLSGRKPEYQLIDDAELKLTIFAAKPPNEPGLSNED